MSKKYTEKEIEFISNNAGKISITDIAQILNRTKGSIISKCSDLKIPLRFSNKKFTTKEIEYLKKNAGKMSVGDIAKKLDRTKASIQAFSDKNSISTRFKKGKEWSENEIEYIRNNASKMSAQNIADTLGVKIRRIYHISHKNKISLNFDKRKEYDEYETKFIKKNVGKMSVEDIAKKLGVTEGRVINIAKKHKISYAYDKLVRYTSTEIKFIKENANNMSVEDISKILKRSATGIKSYCYDKKIKLEFNKIQKYSSKDIDFIRENAHQMSIEDISKSLNRTISGVRRIGSINKINFTFLRENNKEEKLKFLTFLLEYKESFIHAKTSELILFLEKKELYDKLKRLESFKKIVLTQPDSIERVEGVNNALNNSEENIDTTQITDDDSNGDILISEDAIETIFNVEEPQQSISLPVHDLPKDFKLFDDLIGSLTDQEKIDYIVNSRVNEFHNTVMSDPSFVETIQNTNGGEGLTLVKNMFLNEYNSINQMSLPEGWSFINPKTGLLGEPNYMQKLITYKLAKHKSFGNWSSTGAGKTLSAILPSRYLGLKNTMIVAYNSTINQWSDAIRNAFPDSVVHEKLKKDIRFNYDKFNYIIINYEFFQLANSENRMKEFLDNNHIDFVVLDESHQVKQRDNSESIRRTTLKKTLNNIITINPDRHLLLMTATPLINNLMEVKATMELLTSKSYDEIPLNSRSVKSCINWHTLLVNNGIVMNVETKNIRGNSIEVNNQIIEIDGSQLLPQLTDTANDLKIEQILLDHKLKAVKPHIKRGVLIYTYFVDKIVYKVKNQLEKWGFSVGVYTGEDKSGLDEFKNGNVDVLIGSSPVGTGVDGIQEISDTLIKLSLPWTGAEDMQLTGRIERQNSLFDKINIITPIVNITYKEGEETKVWSRDKYKLDLIRYKKDLFNIVMTGNIPSHVIGDMQTVKRKAKKALDELIKKFKNGEISIERPDLTLELLQQQEYNNFKKKLGDFSEMNKNWSNKLSSKLQSDLQSNRKHWEYYHKLYREKRTQWNEIPAHKIAEKLVSRPDHIIADMGCGELLLSEKLSNHKIHAFDHIAFDERATACDIIKTPLNDSSVDSVVFSLSLMGRNWRDYIKEASRIIKSHGHIYIAEPVNKWKGKEHILKQVVRENGFRIFEPEKTEKFIYLEGKKS